MSRPQTRRLTPILAVGVVLIAACGGNSDAAPPVSPSPTTGLPTTSATVSPSAIPGETQTESDRVLGQYTAFFHVFPQASRMREARRNQLLGNFLRGPAYSSAVESLSAQAAFGKVGYGDIVLHPEVTKIGPSTAVVTDCQDTSHSGVKDRKTGRKETRGIPRALVITNLTADGGIWKIVKIDYRGAKC